MDNSLKIKFLSSLEKCFIDECIESKPALEKASFFKNEVFSFQVAYFETDSNIRSKKLSKFAIESPIAEYIKVRKVELVPSLMPDYKTGVNKNCLRSEPGLFPDLLVPLDENENIYLVSGQLKSLWLTIDLRGKPIAGTYPITVIFKDENEDVFATKSINIEVIDAELPEQELIFTQWFHCDSLSVYYGVEAFSEKHWKIIKNFMITAVKNGINLILTPIFTPPLDTQVGGERPTMQLVEVFKNNEKYSFKFDKLDRWIDTCTSVGIKYFEMAHLFTQWGAEHAPKIMATVDGEYKRIFGWETDASGDEYSTFLKYFLNELITYLKNKGVDKRCFYHISDEPSIKHIENYIKAKNIVSDILKDYKINYLDLKSGKVTEPEITIANGNVELRQSFKDQKPSSAAVSPDGKKFALVIRGLLYVSDTKGKYLQKLNTPEDERVDDVIWASDNKTIYYTRTNKGWTDLYKVKADMSEPEKNVYTSKSNVKNLSISHKGDKMAFVDGSRKLMIMSIPSDKVDQIATVEFWSFQNYNLHFSFDDSCLAFESMNKFEPDIFIYSFKDKKLTNLTNSASTERDAWFTPDGKYMYLLANPTSSSFPRGSYGSLYKLPLQKYDTPYKSENYDKLFTKDKPKKDSAVTIDYNDIFRRMTIAAGGGSQYGLYMFSSKGKSWLFYNSQNAGKRACYSLELSDPEAKPREIKDIRGYGFFNSESDLYLFGDGTIYKIDPNSLSTTKIAISQSVEKSLRSEFDQMFYEVWAVLEQNFYDVKYHGADWYKVRDYYASFLPYVTSRQNVRTLITDMLGELNSSHLGFNSRGEEETTKTKVYSTATGIIFRNDAPYTVDRILTDSPADKVEVDVQNGDVLVAVDGVKIDTKDNREKYFASPLVKEEIKLTFKRSDKEFDVKLHTMSYSTQKNLLYTEWEDSRKAMVEKIGKGKVAYIHMRDMGDGSLNSFLQDMHTYAVNKDALILDLRYNNGGNVHKEVLDFLRQQEHFRWSYRDFPKTSHPNVVPARKPIVVLVNEHSLSDAEVTSNGIKTLNIAKIVGTETYRWIIFTSSVRLIDGSSCRMPAWGCYTLEGTDLESIGVKPDIYVKNTFKDRLMGLDPQLETALKEVMR